MVRFNDNKYKNIFVSISNLIRYLCKGDRLKRITKIISNLLKKTHKIKNKKLVILDFGCGSMEISKRIQNKKYIKKIIGTDVFKYNFKDKKLIYMDYKNLFKKNLKFDVIIIVDVLHHIGVDKSHKILKKLSKLTNHIIIKDHFEHGYFSRQLLRFVDFYANYGYGVNIPKKYFDEITWKKTLIKTNFKEVFLKKNFKQHDGIFNIILNKKHHFVSYIQNK